MVHLHVLGSADLRAPAGHSLSSVLLQPKRLALLTYLALARPRGMHRRDTLLALFWPESDAARARNSLSQALTSLRRSLDGEAVVTRGNEEIGIAPEHLWCDAAALEAALDAGHYEEAMALYRGDFLGGFFLSDAPEFERWIEAERERLRRRTAEAAWALSDVADEAGHFAEALSWARRAYELAPAEEIALRRLLAQLDRVGERAEAVRTYEAFASRLRDEFDVDPSAETQALVCGIRARAALPPPTVSPDVPELIRVEAQPEPPQAPAQDAAIPHVTPASPSQASPAGQQGVTRSVAAPRRRKRLAAGALALLVLGGAYAAVYLRGGPPPIAAEDRVLVAGFENRTGDPALDLLGDMAADWITQGLQQMGLVTVVDPSSALLASRGIAADSAHLEGLPRAIAMVREAGAGAVVWGAVYRQDDSLYFRAQVTGAEGQFLHALDPVAAPVSDPMGGAERLRGRVAGALASLADRRMASLQAPSSRPPTFEAYREYILGLELYQRLRGKEALVHFQAAARLDSTFSLPLIWAAFVHETQGDRAQRDSVVQLLAARRDRLVPLDQYALEFLLASGRNDIIGKLAAARAAARLAPGSNWSHHAAHLALAQNRPHEAIGHLRAIDPEHGWAKGWFPYWGTLTNAHHLLGEYEEELDAAQRARRLDPGNLPLRYLEMRALVATGRSEEAIRRLDEQLLQPPDMEVPSHNMLEAVGLEFRAHGHAEQARTMLQRAIEGYRAFAAEGPINSAPGPEDPRLRIRRDLARVLYWAGEWEDSRSLFEAIAAQHPENPDIRTYLGLLAAQRGDRVEAERTIRFLASQKEKYGTWVLREQAMIAALLGERERAVEYLRELVRNEGDPHIFVALHHQSEWSTLQNYPPFKLLVRPKG